MRSAPTNLKFQPDASLERPTIAFTVRLASGFPHLLALHPIERAIERAAKPVEQRIDLLRRDDERRTDRDRVARKEAHDQPFLLGKPHRARPDAGLGIERAL